MIDLEHRQPCEGCAKNAGAPQMAVFQDSAVMCCTVGPMGSSSINMRGYSMMLTLILMLMAWLSRP